MLAMLAMLTVYFAFRLARFLNSSSLNSVWCVVASLSLDTVGYQ